MLIVIRVFQITIMILMMLKPIIRIHSRRSKWNFLKISDWVFYLCGVSSFGLAFGVAAILEDRDVSQYPICLLFSAACLFSAIMMIVQSVWQIRYDSERLIFRNSFGITREFNTRALVLVVNKRMTRIVLDGKTIIKWDSAIMDIKEEIALYKTLRH